MYIGRRNEVNKLGAVIVTNNGFVIGGEYLEHSPKGTTWKDHKYIKKENGRYVYPSTQGAVGKTVGEQISKNVEDTIADTHRKMIQSGSKKAEELGYAYIGDYLSRSRVLDKNGELSKEWDELRETGNEYVNREGRVLKVPRNAKLVSTFKSKKIGTDEVKKYNPYFRKNWKNY